ncbi:MAG: PA2169 family four-helix-bundle protein [Acidobacteria bacterium]|nr:PA2169 family four-helix-bundle protein [Acidobacteriota bacterium]
MINDYEATEPITTDARPVETGGTIDNDDVISCLNGLIETCKDGQNGFRTAAEGTKSSGLRSFFAECSTQRAQFAGELQGLVNSLGGDAENSGSLSGALHRGWIDIKAAITGEDDHAILAECERGEDSAKANYKEALEKALPANVRDIIQTQQAAVLETHSRVKAMRDAAKGTNSSAARTGVL